MDTSSDTHEAYSMNDQQYYNHREEGKKGEGKTGGGEREQGIGWERKQDRSGELTLMILIQPWQYQSIDHCRIATPIRRGHRYSDPSNIHINTQTHVNIHVHVHYLNDKVLKLRIAHL